MNNKHRGANNMLVLPTADDIRAARAFLNWKQLNLAYKCDVSIKTIMSIEKEQSKPTKELLETIAKVFLEEGIRFHPERGFIVDKNVVSIYEGREGYLKILKNVLETCEPMKDEFLLLGADDKRSSREINQMYKKMYDIGIKFKILIENNSNYILGPLEDYREVDKNSFLSKDVILIYKDKIMFVSQVEFKNNQYDGIAKLLLIKDGGIAEQFKTYFNHLWNNGNKPNSSCAKQIFFKK
jgi:DNA-binding XRE family transcriptional regulator